jgi:hypothetical protein
VIDTGGLVAEQDEVEIERVDQGLDEVKEMVEAGPGGR